MKNWESAQMEEISIKNTECGGASSHKNDGCVYEKEIINDDGSVTGLTINEWIPMSGETAHCHNPNN